MAARLPRLYAPATVAGVRGGTPLTLDGAIALLGTLVDAADHAARVHDRTLARYEAVKTPAAKARWRAKLVDAHRTMTTLDRMVTRLEQQIDEYTNALAFAQETRAAEAAEPPEPLPQEPSAPEWQFGLEYEATRRGGHDVDLNIDIRRSDGQPITESEAREALRVRIATGAFPDAYEVAGVVYRSPGSRKASGRAFRDGGFEPDALDEAFDAVIQSTNIHDWRAGGINE